MGIAFHNFVILFAALFLRAVLSELCCGGHHNCGNSKAEEAQSKGYSEKTTVVTQARADFFATHPVAPSPTDPGTTSQRWSQVQPESCQALQGERNATQDDSSPGEDFLAVLSLLENLQGRRRFLPEVQRPLVTCHGHFLCPHPCTPESQAHCCSSCATTANFLDMGLLADNLGCWPFRPSAGTEETEQINIKKDPRTETKAGRSRRCAYVACSSLPFLTSPGWFEPICEFYYPFVQCPINSCFALACRPCGTYSSNAVLVPGDRPRDAGSLEELLSRRECSTSQNSRNDREGRKDSHDLLAREYGPSDEETVYGQASLGISSRGQREPPNGVAKTPSEEPCHVERPQPVLRQTTSTFRSPHPASQKRHPGSWRSNYTPQSNGQQGSHTGACRRQAREYGCTRCQLPRSYLESPTPTNIEGVHRSHRISSHRCGLGRGGGRRWSAKEKGKIQGSWRRRFRNGLMSVGCAFQCLRNGMYEPCLFKPFKAVTFADADAYSRSDKRPLDKPVCAAGLARPDIGHFSLHSVMMDPDCIFDFDAIQLADELHLECIRDETVPPELHQSLHPESLWEIWSNKGLDVNHYYQTGLDFGSQVESLSPCEAVGVPDCQPHSIRSLDAHVESQSFFEAVEAPGRPLIELHFPGSQVESLSPCEAVRVPVCRPSSQQALLIHHYVEPDYAWDLNLDYEVPGDEGAGLIPHLPITALDQHAEWIQSLYRQWTDLYGVATADSELEVRGWYLNPARYAATEVWRPMTFPPSFDDWWNVVRAVFHDLFEHEEAIEAFVVRPDPIRPLSDRRFAFDVIFCQQLHLDVTVRPSLIVTHFVGGHFARLHTIAKLLPRRTSEWELIYLSENHRFCPGPSLNADFFRRCEAWRDLRRIRAHLTEVHWGDCFRIDLYPPMYFNLIDDDGDEVGLLAHVPRPGAPALPLVLNPQAVQQHDHFENEVVPPSPTSSEDDFGAGSSFSVIIYTCDRLATVGRIRAQTMADVYLQAAQILGMSEDNLMRIHEMPFPPEDVRITHDRAWIANRIGDIPQGSQMKFVLVDVVFCDQLPRLDHDVTRNLRLIVSTTTRTTLLRLLGLYPYCSRWPCLVKLNDDFVPSHAPFTLRHADYLCIYVSPPDPFICASTRVAALAFHHGFNEEVFATWANELPDYADLEQMPNPDLQLHTLEFVDEEDACLTQLGPPVLVTRLDESEDIRQRISDVVDQNELMADEAPLYNLDNVPHNLRDLFEPWLEIATTWHNNEHWAPVAAWYISHRRWRICVASKMVWLPSDVSLWRQLLIEAWREQIDGAAPLDFALVRPGPIRREPHLAGHILLVQHHDSQDEHACLVSLQDDDGLRGLQVDRQALIMPRLVTHEALLVVANRQQDCLTRIHNMRCTTRCGSFSLTHEAMIGYQGAAYSVIIERFAQMPAAPFSGSQLFPVALDPNAPRLVRDIHAAISSRRAAEPHVPINLRVFTWYLDHARVHRCLYGRQVDLVLNPNLWLPTILLHWADLYDPSAPVDGYVVTPTPTTSQWNAEDTLHVIIHQRPMDHFCSVLTTTFDQTRQAHNAPGIQRAVVLPCTFAMPVILASVDLDHWCNAVEGRHCRITFGAIPILPDVPFVSQSGFSFRIYFTDTPFADWQPAIPQHAQPNLGTEEEDDVLGWLQTSVLNKRVISINDALSDQEVPSFSVDFTAAFDAWVQLDSHFLVPHFDITLDPASPAANWTKLWWDFFTPGNHLVIYYDGSFTSADTGDLAGFAAAAFLHTANGWAFCGLISQLLEEVHDGYLPELSASLVATKWAFDICKIHSARGAPPPCVSFRFDSMTVGQQAAGLWNSFTHARLARQARVLHDLLGAAFSVEVFNEHVKSHQGEIGNELVDHFAKEAASGTSFGSSAGLFSLFQDPTQCRGLEFCWIFFDVSFSALWSGLRLHLPLPDTQPSGSTLPQLPGEDQPTPTFGELRLTLCTFNVTTLCASRQPDHVAASGPAKQEALLRQMQEKGVHIFALQETRLRKLHYAHDENFFLFRSPATPQGQGGILVGMAKNKPIGLIQLPSGRKRPVYLQDADVHYLVQTSRLLVLRVRNAILKVIIIAAHAPHSGQALSDIHDWWKQTAMSLPPAYNEWPRILLLDANAEVGTEPNDHVGAFLPGPHSPKAEPFLNFVAEQGLFLPSTFEEFHQGERATWLHPSGTRHRLDYVGLPLAWRLQHCATFVDENLDACLARPDHLPVFCELSLLIDQFQTTRMTNHDKLRWDALPYTSLTGFDWSHPCPPNLDVHSHAAHIQKSLFDCLRPQQQKRQAAPRRASMTPSTWQLILKKKRAKSDLMDSVRLHKKSLLQACFGFWKGTFTSDSGPMFDTLWASQDRLIAVALSEYRQLGRCVQQALRHDDMVFYSSFLLDAAEFLAPTQARDLWRVVRRSLPKFRQRRAQPPPFKLAELEDHWVPHFCQLETGAVADNCRLLNDCHARQLDHLRSEDLPCESLFSLFEVEDSIRAVKPDRSTGFDPIPSGLHRRHAPELARLYYSLLLKMFIWKTEPVQWKGGPMAIIPKKATLTAVENGRGIMLLPTMAKVYHALLRKRMISYLERKRPPGQLGGFSHQQVAFGSLALRSFCRLVDSKGLSSAVLFVDLSDAFHRLVRELATGNGLEADLTAVLASLHEQGVPFDPALFRENLLGSLERLGCPVYLVRILQDIHIDTWCNLNGSATIRTRRGTRPGSPLADAIFHIVMADIVHELDAWIAAQTTYVDLLQHFDLAPFTVTWADDLAIPWVTDDPAMLPDAIRALVQQTTLLFERRGFSLNFARGKTGAVVTFRGHKAPVCRKTFQIQSRPGIEISLPGPRVVHLHFEPAYKHLGTYFSTQHDLQIELSCRIGVACSAFSQLSKPLLCNRNLPTSLRLQLFQALIGSRLFFGLGSWPTLSIRMMARLRKVYIGLLRKVLRIPFTAMVTNEEILHRAHTGDVRVRLAVDRLAFAQRLFAFAPAFIHHILHLEAQGPADAWLSGLKADVDWLAAVLPEALPSFWTGDFTDLIDYWQSSPRLWRRHLKKAWRLHCYQEYMMAEVRGFHHTIFQQLQRAGSLFQPAPACSAGREASFPCDCGRVFTTGQGLALHKRHAHGHFSPEHEFVSGSTCSVCLKHFWCSARLQQHLAYIPRGSGVNPCYAELLRRGAPPGYLAEKRPVEFSGLHRLEAIPAAGPVLQAPGAVEVRAARLEADLAEALHQLWNFDLPPQNEVLGPKLADALTLASKLWFRDFSRREEQPHFRSLQDRWLAVLGALDPEFHSWAEFVYLTWGEHELPEYVAQLEDGEAEFILEDEFATLAYDLPRMTQMGRVADLRRQLRHLDFDSHRIPHRPVKRGTANSMERARTQHLIPRELHSQIDWQNHLKQVQWLEFPPEVGIPRLPSSLTRPTFIVAHLFSGRRRPGDVHHALSRWAEHFDIQIHVLSLDTAIDPELGNLRHDSPSWAHLLECYRARRIAATLIGSPCETFSEARHTPPPLGVRWPRPLRSSEQLFGFDQLTMREYRQVHQGSLFFLQGVQILVFHILFGGLFLSEHPAAPQDSSRASIWTSGVLRILRQHPDIHLHTLPQYLWDATVVKPTGLLALNLPRFRQTMFARANMQNTRPQSAAIGQHADGSFKTAEHKEYPGRFCDALAYTLVTHLKDATKVGRLFDADICSAEALSWCQQLVQYSSRIRDDAVWLPDFQGW